MQKRQLGRGAAEPGQEPAYPIASVDNALRLIKADHYLQEPAGAREQAADLIAAWTAGHE